MSSTHKLVEAFYARIWNAGELSAASELLTAGFSFRGSLGPESQGPEEFVNYVRQVRSVLADYRCDVLECVSHDDRAFAQMRFSGRHVGAFRGFEPTGRPVHWLGAALFHFEGDAIAGLWMLGDLAGLDAVLKSNQTA
jgi:predicted ester cyclase